MSKSSGYQCYHCLQNTVVWDNDFSFDDMAYEGDGIAQMFHCANCGARIEVDIKYEDEDGVKDTEGESRG